MSKLFKAAHTIRFDLAELLSSEEAQTIDAQLGKLLAEADQGKAVKEQVRKLLQSNQKTKEWVEKFYAEERTRERGFADLPGKSTTPVSVDQYSCPTPGCSRQWFRRTIAQEIPQCPEHHCKLEPKK